MTLRIIQVTFVLASIIMGVFWANYIIEMLVTTSPGPRDPREFFLYRCIGGATGGAVALLVLVGLRFITQEIFEKVFPVFVAVTLSMMLGYFIGRYIIMAWKVEDLTLHVFLTSTLVLIFGYMGISLGLTRASNWESLVRAVKLRQVEYGNPKIVDTSVIIDGRLADVVQTGFIDGTLLIPRFVLKELQHIADSPDVLRRAKGRRGLDILKTMLSDSAAVKIVVTEDDPPEFKEVDGKLIALARKYNAKVITNDFNLNKVAQIEGIQVLNLNDLANALKPSVVPDERIEVKIVKEGKEPYQGVGYLDDGTMIVVDGGRDYVGKNVSALVTSVLQTAAGRMIFTKMDTVLN